MKERPILFSGEMIRAILDGKKTMTRRVIKPQPCGEIPVRKTISPYGQPGDRLWVRETWANATDFGYATDTIFYRASYTNGGPYDDVKAWKPSIFMPRSASRITLEITAVRVERLQDITDSDIEAEGIRVECGPLISCPKCNGTEFSQLWNSINSKRGYGWDSNPWVWVIEFKRI